MGCVFFLRLSPPSNLHLENTLNKFWANNTRASFNVICSFAHRKNPDLHPSPWSSEENQMTYDIIQALQRVSARVNIKFTEFKACVCQRRICILNPNLSVAPGVSKGFATDLALVALCINVASQQAGKGKECVIFKSANVKKNNMEPLK